MEVPIKKWREIYYHAQILPSDNLKIFYNSLSFHSLQKKYLKIYCRKKTKLHPGVQDVHQQQQEQTLSNIHIPRDISATDLAGKRPASPAARSRPPRGSPRAGRSPQNSPATARKNIFNLPNMSNIKKSFTIGLKNIPKINFIPIKKNGQESDSEEGKDIAEGQSSDEGHLTSRPPVLKSQSSKDDSDIVDASANQKSEDMENSIVLESCGILATGYKQTKDLSQNGDEEEASEVVLRPKKVNDKSSEKLDDNLGKSESSELDADESSESQIAVEVQRRLSAIVPKLRLPTQKTRRIQRILDDIQLDIQTQMNEKQCISEIIFI